MSHRRTANRVTRLCGIVAIITLLHLAAAPSVYPIAAPEVLRNADGTWTDQGPAILSARHFSAMAFLGGDQVLLFGGLDGSYDGETWVYDLSANTWTNQEPAAGPSARYGHAMASLGGDQAPLFGGWEAAGVSGETWVYDLTRTRGTLPSGRDR